MKTVVLQSYRTHHVPEWLQLCQSSVRAWAAELNYDYTFMGDEIFDLAPDWYRARAAAVRGGTLLVADLVRLLRAQQLLADGYERVLWLDADVLIFNPEALALPALPFACCRELWVQAEPDGSVSRTWKVNNAVCQFRQGNPMLAFYADACLRIVGAKDAVLSHLSVGTDFLTGLHAVAPLPLFTAVGLLSPLLIEDLGTGNPVHVADYMRELAIPLAAANLCRSFSEGDLAREPMTASLYSRVVRDLSESRGAVLNRHLEPVRRTTIEAPVR